LWINDRLHIKGQRSQGHPLGQEQMNKIFREMNMELKQFKLTVIAEDSL
jgi:hypothetical protein